jgi:hypothetical protein
MSARDDSTTKLVAPDRVETDRMVGERVAEKHLVGLLGLYQDPAVVETLWPGDLGGTRTREQTWMAGRIASTSTAVLLRFRTIWVRN